MDPGGGGLVVLVAEGSFVAVVVVMLLCLVRTCSGSSSSLAAVMVMVRPFARGRVLGWILRGLVRVGVVPVCTFGVVFLVAVSALGSAGVSRFDSSRMVFLTYRMFLTESMLSCRSVSLGYGFGQINHKP